MASECQTPRSGYRTPLGVFLFERDIPNIKLGNKKKSFLFAAKPIADARRATKERLTSRRHGAKDRSRHGKKEVHKEG